ncbi:MAG: Rne/Rng family ribonuclease [Marinilabiliaceae bacterium]|nr:Rne/Rng family ribonuclease [Marinilabiliaceae bacterium]
MNAELFIHVSPDEMTIALVEDKKLVELRKEKRNVQFEVGDIYVGKVRKLMPGLNAAFVNVGYEKDAFLHYLDLGQQFRTQQKFLKQVIERHGNKQNEIPHVRRESDIEKNGTITDVLQQGEEVLVQVAKEPISTKGPRLTCEISLAGRNLVLMPFNEKISVSKKIKSGEERNRLRAALQKKKAKDVGVIIRTVAENCPEEDIVAEYELLYRRWLTCVNKASEVRPPALALSEMERANTMLRDLLSPDFNTINVDDETVYQEVLAYVRQIAPERVSIVKLYNNKVPMFDAFNIERQIRQSCGKTVSFKSGAYLIIETTEALNVIDVNSGNKSKSAPNQENNALEVNLAAADEIARQLRLRDMGGIVVVDFIDMQLSENRLKLYERMKEAMSSDRTKHNILPLSKFGLMQITRQRVRPVMAIDTTEVCPMCLGKGRIDSSVNVPEMMETAIEEKYSNNKGEHIDVFCNPYIYAYLKKGFPSRILRWKLKYTRKLHFHASASMGVAEFKITNENSHND